jgi:branched-chain amino acid transport system ATP-binding protein
MGPIVTVLRLDGLEKAFNGIKAVDGVSLSVAAGEMVALIGPNGAGKTTTFNLVNGQLAPDRGHVLLSGRDVTGLEPRALWRQGMGRTFQITATFNSMTVADNVRVALLSHYGEAGLFATAAGRYADEIESLLSKVGIEGMAQSICGLLAYGDLKRVELAMALVNEPRLLLVDEPTAGMAPRERGQLMALVSKIARERGTAVLFTEHDMDVVFGHAARIFVMHRGKIIAAGRPGDVRNNAAVRAVYLGADPVAGSG